jgi:superfamily II DNA/RNA helicase
MQRERIVRYQNLDELTTRIAPWSSLVMRSDLGDMPSLIRTERPVVMSEKQRQAYVQMVAQHLAEVEDQEVVVKDAGARMIKLQQILSGYVMDTKMKAILTIDEDAPIYDAVIDEIRGTIPGKALVWCRYKEDCRRLMRKLGRRKMPALAYWGDYSTTVREANRAKFLSPGDESTVIGTPDCGGEGLDFSAADAVIFMTGNPNARMMAQAEERATVKGGKSVAIVRIRNYGTVCDRIWDIVDGNISLADTITGSGLRRLLTMTDI